MSARIVIGLGAKLEPSEGAKDSHEILTPQRQPIDARCSLMNL